MPFSVLFCVICCGLGMCNAGCCRIGNPVERYMKETGQETICCRVEGRIKRIEYGTDRRILIIRTGRMTQEEWQWNCPCTIKVYEQQAFSSFSEGEDNRDGVGQLCVGNQVLCEISLRVPAIPTNPGEFNGKAYNQARGIDF